MKIDEVDDFDLEFGEEYHIHQSQPAPPKALLLSLVLPGLGQIYNTEKMRGLVFVGIAVVMLAIIGYTQLLYNTEFTKQLVIEGSQAEARRWASSQVPFRGVPIVVYIMFAAYCVYDAYAFAAHTMSIGLYQLSSLERLAEDYNNREKEAAE